MTASRLYLLIVGMYCCILHSSAQTFTNIAAAQGIQVLNNFPVSGNAISFYDFDRDGWDDLTFGTMNQQLKFYRNNQGTFEAVVFPGINFVGDCKMVTWVDYDNDGDADLFASYNNLPVKLYRNNGDMTFENVAGSVGLEQANLVHWGASWGDVNRDGWLDLYLCKKYDNGNYLTEYQKLNRLYISDGDGTFTDMTTYAGVGDSIGISFQAILWDYDNDMWPDIYVANDKWFANGCYRNNGDLTFEDTGAETGLDVIMDAMCTAAGDYDNDGDEDMYITNTPGLNEYIGNVLFNNNDGVFTDVSGQSGTMVVYICWGTTWFDYDNDGWLDFYVATNQGFFNPPNNKIYRNNANGTFTDVSAATGMLVDIAPSYSNCTGDINNDGYPDLAANNTIPYNAGVFLSSGGDQNYLKFSVEGVISNRDGIGTKAFCYINGALQSRVFYCGENYISQNSQREIFGLGSAESVDSLILYWPSGHIDKFFNLNSNQTLHIVEGSSLQVNTSITGSVGICEGDSIVLYATDAANYLWNTEATSDSIVIYSPGIYYASTTNELGLSAISDTLEVFFFPQPAINVMTDTPSCHDSFDAYALFSNDANTGIESILLNNEIVGNELSNLAAGYYEYFITDTNGCGTYGNFEILAPPVLTVDFGSVNVSCYGENDGTAYVINTAGTGIDSVIWNESFNGANIEDLAAGEYQFMLTDLNGCQISNSVTISEPELLIAIAVTTPEIVDVEGGTATANVSGGTPPYIFDWSTGSSDIIISGLVEGAYGLTVIDANGCETDLICFVDQIVGIQEQAIITPKIAPNPSSGLFEISQLQKGNQLSVYSANGQLLLTIPANNDKEIVNLSNYADGLYFLRISGSDTKHYQLIKRS
jgi:hypothetical protein